MHDVNGPDSHRNVSDTLWNPCHEERRLFWEHREALLRISAVFSERILPSVLSHCSPFPNTAYYFSNSMHLLYSIKLLVENYSFFCSLILGTSQNSSIILLIKQTLFPGRHSGELEAALFCPYNWSPASDKVESTEEAKMGSDKLKRQHCEGKSPESHSRLTLNIWASPSIKVIQRGHLHGFRSLHTKFHKSP